MQKIAILGAVDAGKTVLARQLGDLLRLPVTHLDALRYDLLWDLVPYGDFAAAQRRLVAGPAWMIDGDSLATLSLRAAAADTIIALDVCPAVCLWGISSADGCATAAASTRMASSTASTSASCDTCGATDEPTCRRSWTPSASTPVRSPCAGWAPAAMFAVSWPKRHLNKIAEAALRPVYARRIFEKSCAQTVSGRRGGAGSVGGMGLLFVLLTPTERPRRLRRTTRKQRREQRVSGAEVWKAAAGDGLFLDVELDVFLPLVNRAGGTRLTVLGQLDPWSDGVLHPADRRCWTTNSAGLRQPLTTSRRCGSGSRTGVINFWKTRRS
jgi:hypothetical protein